MTHTKTRIIKSWSQEYMKVYKPQKITQWHTSNKNGRRSQKHENQRRPGWKYVSHHCKLKIIQRISLEECNEIFYHSQNNSTADKHTEPGLLLETMRNLYG